MVRGVGLLLSFQLAGELVVWGLRLPVSGPICGMAALLVWLCWLGRVPDDLAKVSDGLLANMAILFVPVGAGVIAHADLFRTHWPAVSLAVVLGTFAAIAATAMTARGLASAPTARIGRVFRASRGLLLAHLLARAGKAASRRRISRS
jgi:holin-like protein